MTNKIGLNGLATNNKTLGETFSKEGLNTIPS